MTQPSRPKLSAPIARRKIQSSSMHVGGLPGGEITRLIFHNEGGVDDLDREEC